ncbi:MAG TPA: RDD family protein, partial [Edaphobacter sp.]|nr:RDD family protein [Edaphobacter sp.]
TIEEAPFALTQQVAERLAAHRARRGQTSAAQSASPAHPAKPRTARIAATVAERFAHSQSYRAYLAAEAEKAMRQAEAAAEVAARNAEAIAQAQTELLAELDQWELTPPPVPEVVPAATDASAAETKAPSFTVQMFGEIARPAAETHYSMHHGQPQETFEEDDERLALEDEIAFRQSPTFEDPVAPIELPANLIEFPRQLVASRKARPRYAEGPLREEAEHTPDATQLRIFEVEPTQISPEPAAESVVPEWSSILLGALPAAARSEAYAPSDQPVFQAVLPLQPAPLQLRVMAALVDGFLVLLGLLGFAATVAYTLPHFAGAGDAAHIPAQIAAIGAGGTLALLTLLYQAIFFLFSDATPGMRYARIAFCTFDDENPSRRAIRRRIVAAVLAACPLGIGFLWAWLDDDRLSWHDRISRIYQRSY